MNTRDVSSPSVARRGSRWVALGGSRTLLPGGRRRDFHPDAPLGPDWAWGSPVGIELFDDLTDDNADPRWFSPSVSSLPFHAEQHGTKAIADVPQPIPHFTFPVGTFQHDLHR